MRRSSVDAVFAAEAFHWFDDDRGLTEIARVLRPRGALVVMWNLPAGPTEPSIAAVEQLLDKRGPKKEELGYDPLDLNTTRYASGEWRRAIAQSPFEELQETRLPNPQTLDRDGLVAFFASMGWIADLPDVDRVPLLDEVRALLAAGELPAAVGDARLLDATRRGPSERFLPDDRARLGEPGCSRRRL